MITLPRYRKSPVVYIVATLAVIAALISLGVYLVHTSRAADTSRFNPGNIMSDAVMSNKGTMSVQQIQAFLDSKNACNNTNVHMAAWYPHLQYSIRDGRFVCMAKESFNGRSAAQLIWQVAQDYSINPQVLIVLLEKEQGLVSDTWPNHVQYRTATGFGCPDTAPCDAQYFGLENQLRLAANLFRTVLNGGWSNYPVGHTFVQYNPNAGCGGSVIHIQNRATSALYRYTPYQPNQAALNAGYGTGDGCSAYGNRNFWMLFTDWFGDTQQAPTFERMETARYLTPSKEGVRKINLTTYQATNPPLSQGQLVYFSGRIPYNGEWCLRTRLDRDLNNNYCIPFKNLKEVPVNNTSITKTRIEITNPNAVKTNPVTEATQRVLKSGQTLAVSQKFTFNGTEYYRSTFDVTHNTGFGIKVSDTRVANLSISSIPETNLSIKTNGQSFKTDVWSTTNAVNLPPLHLGQSITVSGKVTINDELYYISKVDYNGQNTLYAINARHLNLQSYSRIIPEQNMRVTQKTCKYDLDANKATSTCYDPGTVLTLTSKTEANSKEWYRTTWETNYNTNLVIDPADLSSN